MTDEELVSVLVDTEAGLGPADGYGPTIEAVRALIAERDRLRAALEMIAIPPIHVPDLSEGCEGCAGVARAALDGTDYRGPISVTPAQAVTGPTSPEYQALVQQAMDLADERDRLIGHLNEYARSCLAHVAERDRLRAVVEAVVAALASEEMEPDEWSEVEGVVRDVVAGRDRLRVKAEEADVELTDFVNLITPLMHGTANALKGEPAPLHMHDWSDLPKVAAALIAERDRLRAGLDEILGGLVGLDSDDAYVAITMEHMNVVRAMLRKDGT